jgi:probable rRNA maturation factor
VPARRAFEAWARGALTAAPRTLGRAPLLLSIRIVGAARSRALNHRYRGKPRPTNVLSFAGAGPLPDGRRDLGELVICAPVLEREARTQRIARAAHWAHITVHGVLHLLGYDHARGREARQMERREVQILGSLGFSDPYD